MANIRPLVITSAGVRQRQQDADVLIAGSGITTSSGNLSLSSAGSILLGVNTTISAGVLLSTAGSGNINLPNNGSARFQVEGVGVSANVTAANLATLTGGGNADSLHTHAASAASEIALTGLTTIAMVGGVGTFGYLSSANTVTPTDSAAIGTSRVVGCYTGTNGSVVVAGTIAAAKFTTVGNAPSVGSPVYLAAAGDDTSTGAGKLTATVPSSGVVAEVGICVDASGYAASKTAKVLLQVKTPIVL